MFTHLIFIIIVLLLVNFSTEFTASLIPSASIAFLYGMGTYVLALIAIWCQSLFNWSRKKRGQAFLLLTTNILLIAWMCLFFFLFGSQRFIFSIPFIGSSQFLLSLICVALYLVGIAVYYCSVTAGALRYIELTRQLRLIIPFVIPYFVFTLLADITLNIPNPLQALLVENRQSLWGEAIIGAGTLLFFFVCMAILPYFIQMIWKCTPLQDAELLKRLNRLCQRVHFKHSGMLTWTVMNPYHTAAIVGIVPRFRYVMFTQSLINYLHPDEVEAILAHEIGHSKHYHMLKYPFIILGMLTIAGLFSLLFGEAITNYINIKNITSPSAFWDVLQPIALVVPYILIIGLYFRFVFGYFSRQFERQADLYPLTVDIPSSHVIGALDHVAEASGGIHKQPSWHHFSIQERIDFLEYSIENPETIAFHHKKVNYSLWTYYALLMISVVLLLSPSFPEAPFFGSLGNKVGHIRGFIDYKINAKPRDQAAKEIIKRYALDNKKNVRRSIEAALTQYGATWIPGIVEFYAADYLADGGNYKNSARLMIEALQLYDFSTAPPEVVEQVVDLANQISSGLGAYPQLSYTLQTLLKEKIYDRKESP